jgi:hypothetical protein
MMRRTISKTCSLVLLGVAALTLVGAAASPSSSARAVTSANCPHDLLPLPANPITPSVAAALVGDRAANRPQVTGAAVASTDVQRGAQVKAQCGARLTRRTVVVYITDRALLPSQSLSQRVVFVGRTSHGYRVWQRAH